MCYKQILITLVVLIVVYYLYAYYMSHKESFADSLANHVNSRRLSPENTMRVMRPPQWRNIHKGESDIHPIEF
jgi:hypothetical protein